MQAEQIVSHGYTTQSDWQELEQRSIKTRRKIDLRCPLCSGEIHPTRNGAETQGLLVARHSFDTTDLRCGACDAPVEIYQHAELTKTADRRVIYIQVKGQRKEILRLKLQCLSCERRLQADETCTNTCGIQTYLVLDFQDGELYIKRAANLLDTPRDTPFIEIRTETDIAAEANDTPETLNSVENSVENSVQKEVSHHDDRDRTTSCSVSENSVNHSDAGDPPNQPLTRENERPYRSADLTIPEKIVEFLTDINEDHTATGTQIKDALGGLAPSTFKWAMDQLIKDGKAYKVAYNLYRLRT